MAFLRRKRKLVEGAVSDAVDFVTEGQVAELNAMQKMSSTLKAIMGIFVIMILISALVFSRAEGKSFWDGIWYATVTATTVGYGDQYPVTISGRIGGMVLALLMSFFIAPIITAKWAARAIVDSDAWTHLEQEQLKSDVANTVRKLDAIIAHLGITLPDADKVDVV